MEPADPLSLKRDCMINFDCKANTSEHLSKLIHSGDRLLIGPRRSSPKQSRTTATCFRGAFAWIGCGPSGVLGAQGFAMRFRITTVAFIGRIPVQLLVFQIQSPGFVNVFTAPVTLLGINLVWVCGTPDPHLHRKTTTASTSADHAFCDVPVRARLTAEVARTPFGNSQFAGSLLLPHTDSAIRAAISRDHNDACIL